MAGIRIYNKNAKATSKVLSALASYMFEQEYGELRKASPAQIKVLEEAKKVLSEIINAHN